MQPVPNLTAADVERIVSRDYPASCVEEAMAILREYGVEPWHKEVDRVRVGILKLADGNVKKLRRDVESAKNDFRDILAAAEYPNYFDRVPGPGALSVTDEQRIIDGDWKQYQAWLQRSR